jgi:hypothetical protein
MRKIVVGLVAGMLLALPSRGAAGETKAGFAPALGWDRNSQGAFPVSLASDASGNVWVGTEGNGLWEYDAVKQAWTQFTTRNGLGDDCVYALAVDQQNRIWVGHLNHGVSVYNGKEWKNYGLVNGPLGDRVFAIVVNPKDGNVWIATDMGLACYSEARHDWDYYTRASGLPSDQIQCITFDPDGKVYAGTQCSGIVTAGPDDHYATWHTISQDKPAPAAPAGDGLASNFINCIATITPQWLGHPIELAGTPFGMTSIAGDECHFIHGADWRDHVPGPYSDAKISPAEVPLDDWITVLQRSGDNLWIGYRRGGVEHETIGNLMTRVMTANVAPPAFVMIRAILALPDHPPLFATYDRDSGGLMTLDSDHTPWKPAPVQAAVTVPPPLPTSAPPPSPDEARVFSNQIGKLIAEISAGEAYFLCDDWRTEGDWVGHYGSAFAKICGINSKDEDYALQANYDVTLDIGPHHAPDDKGVDQYMPGTGVNDLHSLYSLELGAHQNGEDNDWTFNLDTYPESYAGPDLWARVTVPDGVQCLSFYFHNYDGHGHVNNKYRDYDVEILPDLGDPAKTAAAPPLARTRVTDFWGGVYKQFLVCGPANFVVRIGRDRSFVTKVQGIFLDRVTGHQQDNPGKLPGFDSVTYQIPDEPQTDPKQPLAKSAAALWDDLDASLGMRGAVPLQMPFHLWCYRAAVAGDAPPALLARWRWELGIWNDEDRKNFDDAMKAAHAAAAQ